MTRLPLALAVLVLLPPSAAGAQSIWDPAPEPEYAAPPEEPTPPDAEAVAAEEPPAATESDDDPELRVRVAIGAGVGRLNFDWPAEGQTRTVKTGAFAAIDLGVGFAVAFSRVFAIGPQLEYQSSIGSEVEETHTSGASDTLRIRAGRLWGLLATEFRLGVVRLSPAIGYGWRSLRPEVHHLLTPSYSLHGPLGRLALRIAIGDQFAIRIAPELQYLVIGQELEELGMHGSGFSFGGELAFELRIAQTLALELSARDAHASLPATLDESSSELGQFATFRLVWEP